MENAEVQIQRVNGPRTTDNGRLATDVSRHFAWELFSAGTPVKQKDKDFYEVPVAVCGAWVKNGHTFAITFEDLQHMLVNFQKRKNDMVVIDYEHASEDPSVARGGPVPAAGWIHDLFLQRAPSSSRTRRHYGHPAK